MVCPGIDPNPDISGIGVRAAIYVQAFLTLVQPILASRDGWVSDKELASLHLLYIGILLPGCALLLSAVIQVAKYGISAYHMLIVLYLSWINNTSALVFFQFVLIGQLQQNKDRRLRSRVGVMLELLRLASEDETGTETERSAVQEVIKAQAGRLRATLMDYLDQNPQKPDARDYLDRNPIFEGTREVLENVVQTLFTLSKAGVGVGVRDEFTVNSASFGRLIQTPGFARSLRIDVHRHRLWARAERIVQRIPGALMMVNLLERDIVLASLSSAHLTFVSGVGIKFWLTLNRSGHCEQRTKLFLFHKIPLTSPSLRNASLFIYAISLIPFLNIAFWAALELPIVYPIFLILDRPPPMGRKLKDMLASPSRTVLYSFIGLTAVMQVYFVVATELTINANESLLKTEEASINEEREWTFGQTLAVALTILPLLQVGKELWELERAYGREKSGKRFGEL